MPRVEPFAEPFWRSDSLEDVGALLGSFIQSPIAAAFAALSIVLLIGVAFLGRTVEPSVVPTGGTGSSTEPRVTFAPTQVERMTQGSSANVSVARFYVTRNNSFQPLAKLERTQAPDLRLFGRRSNASLERGPPDEAIVNSVAGRAPSNRYPLFGTRKARLR
jgi:hypothetical protein